MQATTRAQNPLLVPQSEIAGQRVEKVLRNSFFCPYLTCLISDNPTGILAKFLPELPHYSKEKMCAHYARKLP